MSACHMGDAMESGVNLWNTLQCLGGIELCTTSFSVAIGVNKACWISALQLVDNAYACSFDSMETCYSSTAQVSAKAGAWLKALLFLHVVKASHMTPSLSCFNLFASICHECRLWEDALGLLADIKSIGVRASLFFQESVLDACCAYKVSRWEETL